MKNVKKSLAIFLSLLMLLTVCPFAAFAEDEPGNEPDIAFSYDEGTKTLTFTGSGPMTDYEPSEDDAFAPETPWSEYFDETEYVVIGEGITTVGDFAFTGFTELITVTLPQTLTSIGKYAFAYDLELASVNIPAGVTDIGYAAFVYNKLSTVVIPAGVTELSGNFNVNLVPLEVTLNEGLESIDTCFESCVIESLTIPSTVKEFNCDQIINTKTLINNSPHAVVSDSLSSMNEASVETAFLVNSLEMRYELTYVLTGEYFFKNLFN